MDDKAARDLLTQEMRACVDTMRRGVDDFVASLRAAAVGKPGKLGDGTSGHELYMKYIDPRLSERVMSRSKPAPEPKRVDRGLYIIVVQVSQCNPWKTVGQWIGGEIGGDGYFVVPGSSSHFLEKSHPDQRECMYRVMRVGPRIDLGDIPNE